MRAPEGLSKYLRTEKGRGKTGKFSEGSGLSRYPPDTARRAGSEGDTDEK